MCVGGGAFICGCERFSVLQFSFGDELMEVSALPRFDCVPRNESQSLAVTVEIKIEKINAANR